MDKANYRTERILQSKIPFCNTLHFKAISFLLCLHSYICLLNTRYRVVLLLLKFEQAAENRLWKTLHYIFNLFELFLIRKLNLFGNLDAIEAATLH
jgi:hypothetical protein